MEDLDALPQLSQQIIDSAQEGIIVYGSDLRYLLWNPFMEQLTGLSSDDVIGRHPHEVFPFLDEVGVIERLEKVLCGTTVPAIEFPYDFPKLNKSGWTADTSSPLFNEQGEIVGVLGIVREITAKKLAERESQQTNLLLTMFMEHSPIYTYLKQVTPSESRVLLASENFEKMIGIPGSKMIGKTMAELFPAELASKMTADDWDVVSRKEILEIVEELNGRLYTSIKFPIQQETRSLLAGYTIDITEKKQAESQLIKQKYYLEKAQELGRIGTWELDITNNTLVWTDENCRIFGVTPGSIVNYEVFIDKVHPDDREYVKQEWSAVIEGKKYDIEHRIVIAGETRWVREKANITFDSNGTAVSAIGFTQDITERKKTEIELQRHKK